MQTNYHTQHSPPGAFASFTIGLHGSPGGFGQSLSGPAGQNHYVGFGHAGKWKLLPFFEPPKSLLTNFVSSPENDAARDQAPHRHILREDEFERTLGWCSDTWTSGGFSYSLQTPFDILPNPETCGEAEARFAFAPVVFARLRYDNTQGTDEVELVFGFSHPDRPWRPLQDEAPDLNGFAISGQYGFAVASDEGSTARQGFNILETGIGDAKGLHRITQECGFIFCVRPGACREIVLVLGFYEGGQVTGGIPARYWYTRYFSGLESVLRHGLALQADYLRLAEERDSELQSSGLSTAQQFLLAQATHSYYGSSQLLDHDARAIWNVNEGEYRMINTFDLTVDHLFFELRYHPWAVKNVLELFASRYSYADSIHDPQGRTAEGGISFTHDMGVMNQFSPAGNSSYECIGLHGCFSYMTCEQLVNWVCCAVTYAETTADLDWLRAQKEILLRCAESLRRRDNPDPALRNGILKWDSNRCGQGSEITTYDSLDVSLGQARNNLYLAVKTWAAWVLLEKAFARLNLEGDREGAAATARLLAESLVSYFEPGTGMFPAVFEGGNSSRIIPAVEGLAFPLYLNLKEIFDRDGPYGKLMTCLESHLGHVLQPGICLDATTGAWKLSSTSTNTWMSKIALCQYVVHRLFPDTISPLAAAADLVHAGWESSPGCGTYAMCDQIESTTGKAVGSKYYPRIVTAILWLHNRA